MSGQRRQRALGATYMPQIYALRAKASSNLMNSLRQNRSRIVGPMKERLSLSAPTLEVPSKAVLPDLYHVPAHSPPALDLTLVVRTSPAGKIPAVPLKPAPRIFPIYPALLPPDRQGLGSCDAEEVQARVVTRRRELGIFEPLRRELGPAIRHVFPAKDTEPQHFRGSKCGSKIRVEALAHGFGEEVGIVLLHEVVNDDAPTFHFALP